MKVIWHIVKKDLRRFWLPIAALTAVLAIKAVLYCMAVTGTWPDPAALNGLVATSRIADFHSQFGSPALQEIFILIVPVLTITDFVLLIVLVLGVLLEDPTMGDRTFWRTRPIAGWRMLAAKTVFLFFITWFQQAVLQVAANLYPVVYNYYSGSHLDTLTTRHWYDALGTLTLIQAGWISVLSITALLWRSPVIGIGSLLGIYFGMAVTVNMIPRHIPRTVVETHTAITTALTFWLCTTTAVAAWMYCGRRRSIGFMIFGVGLAAIYLVTVL